MGHRRKQKKKFKFILSMLFFGLSLFIFACGKTTGQKETASLVIQDKDNVSSDAIHQEDIAPIEKEATEIEENEGKVSDPDEEDKVLTLENEVSAKEVINPIPPKKEEPKIPKIFFEEKVHKFGDIDQGDTIVHSYMFINTGNAPLYILDVDLSCGCTMSDYPKVAIKPRQAGYIELLFNSTHKEGSQRQYAIVSSNTIPGKDTLLLAGVVYRKMEELEEDSLSN